MGARTVQNMAMYGESSVRGRPGRAFSSSDLLGEKKDHGDEVLDTQEAVVLTPRSLQSRAKSHSHILSSRKDPEVGVKRIFKANTINPYSYGSGSEWHSDKMTRSSKRHGASLWHGGSL